jgi:NAD(P)-dependent dehydrogenase (short-subunit alcohol dehydrogenase family)
MTERGESAKAGAEERATERWALVLGASSGFGEATAIALAEAGYGIVGVHLDFRAALKHVDEILERISVAGSESLYLNMNAAADDNRAAAIEKIAARFDERRRGGADPQLRVVVHSLAFGTLLPFVADEPKDAISRKQMEMTLDVMANSLVYWVQDLYRAGLIGPGTHVYAMTSEGSSRVIPSYGAVSAAKSALESHCRQLAAEFARKGAGITVNAIRAGVTVTPALMKIPEAQLIIEAGERRNPSGRLTTPQDVASAIVRLSEDGLDWVTGNVIGVDGGEFISG